VVERFARRLARVDRGGKALVDVVVAELTQLFLVAAPERLEHHAVGRLGAFEESEQVETAVGRGNVAQPALDSGRKLRDLAVATRQVDRGLGDGTRHVAAL